MILSACFLAAWLFCIAVILWAITTSRPEPPHADLEPCPVCESIEVSAMPSFFCCVRCGSTWERVVP